jgi:PhzF family phenazine biosynthesis protein
MSIQINQVDAFTDRPFGGNPAAVVMLPDPRPAAWMQALAAEMNLSETAFLTPRDHGYDLRWFTPTVEVELCGHATLASAHVLWESGTLQETAEAHFHTRSGLLRATRHDTLIEIDLPARREELAEAPPELVAALGVTPIYVGRNLYDYLVELPSEAAVRELAPDFVALRELDIRGIIVTSRATTAPYDFVSRFFAPGVGIDEDPVTGSAHCCLVPFWSGRLGKSDFVAYQASARGGVLRVSLRGDRVALAGQAVTIFRGELSDDVVQAH